MAQSRLSADEMDCLLNGLSMDITNVDSNGASLALPTRHVPASADLEAPKAPDSAFVSRADAESRDTQTMDTEQSRAFQAVHEVLADRAARAWSEKLRAKIDVRVTKIARPSFGEFAFGLDNPTCFVTLDVAPFTGRPCLEFHPTVLFPMIDRLLGGGKKAGPIVRRPLTEIETRLLNRLASVFFEQFRFAWRPYAVVAPEVYKIESNPKLSRCVPAADPVEAVEFEVNMPFARGPIRMAYPSASLVVVYDHLSGAEQTPLGADLTVAENLAEVRVLIAERTLESDAPEYNVNVGDIITTNVPVSELVQVQVDGETRFLGRIGQQEGVKAVRLEEVDAARRAG